MAYALSNIILISTGLALGLAVIAHRFFSHSNSFLIPLPIWAHSTTNLDLNRRSSLFPAHAKAEEKVSKIFLN